MRSSTPARPLALVLVIALLGIGHAGTARAATPALKVIGQTTAPCGAGGKPAAAGSQGKPFAIEAAGLANSEPIEVWYTFPDGRIYSPSVASFESAPQQPGLDGLIDRLSDPGYADTVETDGSYYREFPTTFKWPYGCYTISLKRADQAKSVTAPFVIVPERVVASPGPARLAVQSKATRGAAGPQGSEVSVIGSGFVADSAVNIEVIQPNGTVLFLPAEVASARGAFQTTYQLDTSHRTGQYTFIATGPSSDPAPMDAAGGKIRRVVAGFSLTAQTLPPMGRATLRVSDPSTAIVRQENVFQIQGQRFNAAEPVTLGLILPGGAILKAPNALMNPPTASGSFSEDILLDRQLPTGTYRLLAEQGTTTRAVVSLKLTQLTP